VTEDEVVARTSQRVARALAAQNPVVARTTQQVLVASCEVTFVAAENPVLARCTERVL
jgi:hypothetical protein